MHRSYIIAAMFFTIIFSSIINADQTVTNTTIGFSAYLPNNWITKQVSDTHAIFYDTTFTCRSQVVIKKHHRNAADYPTPADWTRAHFIAYLLVVQYSWDPFGAVLYFDSTASCKQDSLWAPEAFSEFYTIDTALGAWDEYMRYTAAGDYGYELYALGDTSDMKANIGMYMALIRMIDINVQSSGTVINTFNRRSHPVLNTNAGLKCTFDLSGRQRNASVVRPAGVYVQPGSGVSSAGIR